MDTASAKNSSFSCRFVLIVPCFNEEDRWDENYWREVCSIDNLKVVFINDGSTDRTIDKISSATLGSIHLSINLPANVGKSEAIRTGFNAVFNSQFDGIGFLDADGAFPVDDIRNQLSVFEDVNEDLAEKYSVWSSRVKMAGRMIDRKPFRHYLARTISTFLSNKLKYQIYDTQSGLKLFPYSLHLAKCMDKPFGTKWFVDLEIFLRWRDICGSDMKIWEEPLQRWKDVGGSKLSGMQYFRVLKDLFIISSKYQGVSR